MRPFVQLQRENRFEELSAKLHRTLDRFLAFGEVVGILLCGGLARGYGDHLSEIDLTVFLTPGQYAAYKGGKTPVPLGIAVIDGQLYDIKLVDYEEALAREYSLVELWDLTHYSHGTPKGGDHRLGELYYDTLRSFPRFFKATKGRVNMKDSLCLIEETDIHVAAKEMMESPRVVLKSRSYKEAMAQGKV